MPFPVEERFVEAEEAKLGIRLPSSFRSYLLVSNGGDIEVADDDWQVAPVFDSSERKRSGRTASHIARETASAREWPGFPDSGVVAASNGTGDLLVLVPSTDPSVLDEAVYVWRHETRDLVKVAESFREVVGGVV